jgi:hypothetical protein
MSPSPPMPEAKSRTLAKHAIRRLKVLARWKELYDQPFSKKVLLSCMSLFGIGLFGCVGSRVLIGDFYFLNDHTTFICNDAFCWRRGQSIAFKNQGHVLTRYHCPNHPLGERPAAKRSWALLDTPNLLGTVLVSVTFLVWLLVSFSNFYCSLWPPPPPSESDLNALDG